MGRVKSEGTAPEMYVRRALHAVGCGSAFTISVCPARRTWCCGSTGRWCSSTGAYGTGTGASGPVCRRPTSITGSARYAGTWSAMRRTRRPWPVWGGASRWSGSASWGRLRGRSSSDLLLSRPPPQTRPLGSSVFAYAGMTGKAAVLRTLRRSRARRCSRLLRRRCRRRGTIYNQYQE